MIVKWEDMGDLGEGDVIGVKVESKLPTPPLADSPADTGEDVSKYSKKKNSPKSTKPNHRISKRASNASVASHQHPHRHSQQHSPQLSPTAASSPPSMTDGGRHKRVWKACERCRMKKTKCNGEFPCKRCKDDSVICTAGTRRKTEYKQLPRGYAEVLENTQFALAAAVRKLYTMNREGRKWDLGEPEVDDRGQPVVHCIVDLLGCIRPCTDMDLPIECVFPENEQGTEKLASHLRVFEAPQQQESHPSSRASASVPRHDHTSPSDSYSSGTSPFMSNAFIASPQPQPNYTYTNPLGGYVQLPQALPSASSPSNAQGPPYMMSWPHSYSPDIAQGHPVHSQVHPGQSYYPTRTPSFDLTMPPLASAMNGEGDPAMAPSLDDLEYGPLYFPHYS